MKLENIDKSIQKRDILQGIRSVSPLRTDSLYWSNERKINSPLHHEQTDHKIREFSASKVAKSRVEFTKNWPQELTILKQKINYQAKLTVTVVLTFSLQSRSTRDQKIGKTLRKP